MSEMNRSETRIHNLQLSLLKQKKWDKILAMDWGKDVHLPKPRTIELNGRLKSFYADVDSTTIRVSKDYYQRASPKDLRETLRHELAHAFLMDNNIPYRHGSRTWVRLTVALGVRDWSNYEYQYFCKCGAHLKTHDKRTLWYCRYCGMKNVTKTEYNKLKKIADINAKTVKVEMDKIQVFKDIKRRTE